MAKSSISVLIPAIANSLATFTGLPKPTSPLSATNRCALWANAVNDDFTPVDGDGNPAAYTVVRPFVARPAGTGRNRVAIQAATWGPSSAAATAQNELVYNALLDGEPDSDDRVPRRAWAIAGFTVSIYRLAWGGIVAADKTGATCVFNFEAAYAPRSN